MILFYITISIIAGSLLAYYLFKPRTARILMDPDDKQTFSTVIAVVNSKRWYIFNTDYIDQYDDITIIDLTIPSIFFNKIYNLLLNLNTIDVLEAK